MRHRRLRRAGMYVAAGVALALVLATACAGPRRARTVAPRAEEARVPVLPLVPAPRSLTRREGALVVDTHTRIAATTAGARDVAERLRAWTGVPLLGPNDDPRAGTIELALDGALDGEPERDPAAEPAHDTEEEAFTLDVSPARAIVRARHPAGLFYGAQTLAQLAGARLVRDERDAPRPPLPFTLPCVHIEDAPRFAVRAMHLDVARHFFTKDVVERYVDVLAFYRFNVFHWHLTDDQGFRLEVPSHPELTAVGSRRTEPDGSTHEGAYTNADATEVVASAKSRFITVVPEIEAPGHARAILAAHPELSCTGKKMEVPATWGIFADVLCASNEGTFSLLRDVLDDVVRVFPSKIVHVGGDEVPKTRWNACPKCRARMLAEHVDAEGLQSRFLARVADMLRAHGRRAAVWDEALENGAPDDALVVAWQGPERGLRAARAGHQVLMAPERTVYFNVHQSRSGVEPGHAGYVPWTRVLEFDPTSGGDAGEAARVLGGEGALWTEFVRTREEIELMAMPRMAALAEALWSGGPARTDFASRLVAQRPLLDASHVGYFIEPPRGLRKRSLLIDEARVVLEKPSLFTDGIVRFTTDGSDPTATSPVADGPLTLTHPTVVSARVFLPGGRASTVVRGVFEQARLSPAREVALPSPGVAFSYHEGDFERVPEFAKLAPARIGLLPSLAFAPSFRAERFAVLYEAYFEAPADGIYRLVTRADDGVIVEVDGTPVVVDDGTHAPREADGDVALARGFHAIRIGYFQGAGGRVLELRCEGPTLRAGFDDASRARSVGPCPLVVDAAPRRLDGGVHR